MFEFLSNDRIKMHNLEITKFRKIMNNIEKEKKSVFGKNIQKLENLAVKAGQFKASLLKKFGNFLSTGTQMKTLHKLEYNYTGITEDAAKYLSNLIIGFEDTIRLLAEDSNIDTTTIYKIVAELKIQRMKRVFNIDPILKLLKEIEEIENIFYIEI